MKERIRELLATGLSQRKVAKELNISPASVWYNSKDESAQKSISDQRKRRGLPDARPCFRCDAVFERSSRHKLCPKCRQVEKTKPCPKCGQNRINHKKDSCRKCSPLLGEKSGTWKGGVVKKGGYVMLYTPDHPRKNGSYVFEHILVMEKKIGRFLLKEETVHHKNCVKNDNRESNLELWAKGHPAGARVSDLVEYAKEILLKYENLKY
jgi:hypothetical protein